MTTTRLTRLAIILSSAAMISYSAAAHAGFEWKGPLEAPAPQPSASTEVAPMDNLAPVTSETAPPPAAPAATPAAAPAQAAAPAPAAPMAASAPVQEAPAAATPAAAAPAPSGEAVVSGFAKDVPLVMALQQVVPPGFQYAFATGVDAGTSVSWEGGKPWQSVLSDMLGAHGLGYTIQNSTVVVSAAQGAIAPSTQTAAASASAPAPAAAPAQDPMMSSMPGEQSAAASSSAPAASGNSNAPLNIVSQPPAQDNAAPAPAAAAPTALSAPAQQASAAPAAEAKKEDTVTIHRKKPKTLLERLGFMHRSDADNGQQEEQRTASAPAPQKMAAADVPAPKPAAAPATATDAAPATAQPAAAMTATVPAGGWQGTKGQTLRDVLKAWSDKAGVDLYWSIDYDYRLSSDVGLTGTYDEAVGALLDKFSSVRPQPYGQLHQASTGPRVLVIKSYDLPQ